MWFSLGMVLLLLAITYFHAIQGLFSALLAAVLAILCAALAFATFEYIALNLLVQFKPDYALGLSLIGMFAIPLLVLRVLLDQYVQRACVVPLMVDKAGGFVFGAVAAYVMVGMLAIGLQLIPWGTGFLGFTRVDQADPAKAEQDELWLQPDRFAAKLGSMLSDGVFSGPNSFGKVHPNFVTEIGWNEAVFPTEKADNRSVRRFAPPGAMKVAAAWEETYVYRKVVGEGGKTANYEPKKADSGHKFIRVRMQIEREAQDEDNQQRFTLFQTRLVGDRGADQPEQYHAIAAAYSALDDKAIYDLKGEGNTPFLAILLKPNARNLVDVVFEVPTRFEPRFVEYKGGAREVLKLGAGPPAGVVASAAPGGPAPTPPGGGPPPAPPAEPPGRVAGVTPTGTFFGDSFPNGITMTDYLSVDFESDDAKQALKYGHLHGLLNDQGQRKSKPPLSRFAVPPGKCLLHLNVQRLQAGSTLGKALALAVTTMKNYIVTDSAGRQYRPIGAYVIGKVDASPYIEIQYFPEEEVTTSRGVRPWEKLTENRLQGEYTYVFLYLVAPGAKLVKFSTGGGGVAAVDLSTMNLTAPAAGG